LARRAHEFLPKKPRRRCAVRWHVDETDKATVYGIVCKCLQSDSRGYLFQSITDEKVCFAFTVDEYDDLLTRQDFDLEPNGLSLEKAKAKLDAGVCSTKELRSRDQTVVDLREIAIWKFHELEAEGRTSRTRKTNQVAIDEEIQPYVDKEARKLAKDGVVVSIHIPGAREFEKWIKNYESKGKLGIIPRRDRCGNRTERYKGHEYALYADFARRFLKANGRRTN
jgi:hypothetical protein